MRMPASQTHWSFDISYPLLRISAPFHWRLSLTPWLGYIPNQRLSLPRSSHHHHISTSRQVGWQGHSCFPLSQKEAASIKRLLPLGTVRSVLQALQNLTSCLQPSYELDSIIMPILWLRKLRHREIKLLAWNHTACKWDLSPGDSRTWSLNF